MGIVRDIGGIMGRTNQNHENHGGDGGREGGSQVGAKGHHHHTDGRRRGVANYEWTAGREGQLINPYLPAI